MDDRPLERMRVAIRAPTESSRSSWPTCSSAPARGRWPSPA